MYQSFLHLLENEWLSLLWSRVKWKWNVLFNDACSTFYLWLYGVGGEMEVSGGARMRRGVKQPAETRAVCGRVPPWCKHCSLGFALNIGKTRSRETSSLYTMAFNLSLNTRRRCLWWNLNPSPYLETVSLTLSVGFKNTVVCKSFTYTWCLGRIPPSKIP